jgi:y4mF family transcriptional regulator
VPSDTYPLPNDPAARALREARARFDAGRSATHPASVRTRIQDDLDSARQRFAIAPYRAVHPITSAADLAPLIRKARKRMRMTQQQFADACGVGRRFLSELENGKPSLEFDKVIACALGAGIDLSAKPRIPL